MDSQSGQILSDKREYTGAMVMGRTEVITIGSNKKRKLPESKWYIDDGVNETIVTLEEYEEAQYVIRRRAKPDFITDKHYVLKSHIRCGNCKCCLDYTDECADEYYFCKHGISIANSSECCKDKYFVKQVEHIVYLTLKSTLLHLRILDCWWSKKQEKRFLR